MQLTFYKYQGTGNDFIMVDNRNLTLPRNNTQLYQQLCHRRFGIGADGFIMVQNKEGYDFEMVYFNSDGNESSMCGNGGRCITMFARQLGIIENKARFLAIDGPHDANIDANNWVSLKMKDVQEIERIENDYYLNTGSPHYVRFVDEAVETTPLIETAKGIRYNQRFAKEGTNVNLVQKTPNALNVRTYERGVEDETYSCGTGVTAVALAAFAHQPNSTGIVQPINTPGGNLQITFDKTDNGFENVWLQGPAQFVFEGIIKI